MRIILYWNHGIDLDVLITNLVKRYPHPDFFLSNGPVLHHFGLSYMIPEGILRCSVTRSGLMDSRLNIKKIHRLYWSFTPGGGDPSVRPWIYFSLGRGEVEGDPYDCVKEGNLCQLFVGFQEDFSPWTHMGKPEALNSAIHDYHELKSLFEYLGCDYIEAFSSSWDTGMYMGDVDPNFEGRLFRFAKEGRQILIRPLEERRAMREDEESSWRLVIDPPKS